MTIQNINYRPATSGDLELLMAWRSHPKLYEHFYEQDAELVWEDHVEWWETRTDRRDWIVVVQSKSGWRDVGVVAVSDLEEPHPEVNIWIGEVTLWGEGVASEGLSFVLKWLREEGYPRATARIIETNTRSQRLFTGAGFDRVGQEASGDLLVYEKEL